MNEIKDYHGLRITNENIVYQNWEDIEEKVLKNSEWKFVRLDTSNFTNERLTLIFENQRGIRAYLRNNDPFCKLEAEKLNDLHCDGKGGLDCKEYWQKYYQNNLSISKHWPLCVKKGAFARLTSKFKQELFSKVRSWNLQFGRNMFGLQAPNQNIEVNKLKKLMICLK